ncbi:MAG: hypothetical protein LBG13_02205 [Holosporales bacterium]|nr:hypothetical protein [Holosporales bacterium]
MNKKLFILGSLVLCGLGVSGAQAMDKSKEYRKDLENDEEYRRVADDYATGLANPPLDSKFDLGYRIENKKVLWGKEQSITCNEPFDGVVKKAQEIMSIREGMQYIEKIRLSRLISGVVKLLQKAALTTIGDESTIRIVSEDGNYVCFPIEIRKEINDYVEGRGLYRYSGDTDTEKAKEEALAKRKQLCGVAFPCFDKALGAAKQQDVEFQNGKHHSFIFTTVYDASELVCLLDRLHRLSRGDGR